MDNSSTSTVPFFDSEVPPLERLPRKFTVHFIPRAIPGRPGPVLGMYIDTRGAGLLQLGDLLTDNRARPDMFRGHDCLHLGDLAVLHWSPVLRKLLNRKRKSVPVVDESEDGQRAQGLEELIVALAFEEGSRRRFFAGARRLPRSLLKQVRNLVAGHEVTACSLRDWERALLAGFRALRLLRQHGSGSVTVDMRRRMLTFRRLGRQIASSK